MRKTRFESVWQKRVVMWDVCLKRSFSDCLSPISFFMFGLLCNVVLGGEVFCFRFKRLTNQLGVELLISVTICNLMVRRGKRCVGSRPSRHARYPVVMRGHCKSRKEASPPCVQLVKETGEYKYGWQEM